MATILYISLVASNMRATLISDNLNSDLTVTIIEDNEVTVAMH